jgi:hypothetical protein
MLLAKRMLSHLNMQNYVPSSTERKWTQTTATGNICRIATAVQFENNPSFFRDAEGQVAKIESLSGIGRHPRAKVGCHLQNEVDLFDTSYLELKTECVTNVKHRRVLLYDLGCSIYKENASGSLLSSIPQLVQMYSKNCMNVDHVFAWEARQIPNWYSDVPDHMKHKISFKNKPVSVREFVNVLLYTARHEDYVIVKLDIDNTELELQLIDAIKELHIVDELLFEYHYWFDNLNFGWMNMGWNYSSNTIHNADSALRLMTKLRRNGIRAHFWI